MPVSRRTSTEVESHRIDEDWGSLRWLASANIGNTEGLTVGRVTIKAGESNPAHHHNDCEEVLYLLAGELEHTVGDEVVVLHAGDVLVIPPGVVHVARNAGDVVADMMVIYDSGERDFVPE